METAGEKDLSSLPTAATRAWTICDTVRITRLRRGCTLDMARGGVVVVVVAEPGRGNTGRQVSIDCKCCRLSMRRVIALFTER